ncbi:hypothetical protein [Rhodovastum atsumiense]|uniref:hypothetical protein n=1 Tax=Rhodovastum atsumiense TaxID=504468 RepID=UPI00139F2A75|nr:hypothetical protein [Rhodovastum atsumiense]
MKADGVLRDAVDQQIRRIRGAPAYLATVAPFGVTAKDMPDRNTADLCRAD